MRRVKIKVKSSRRKRFYTKKVYIPRARIKGCEVTLNMPHLAEFNMDDIRGLVGIVGKCTMLSIQRLSGLVLGAKHIAKHGVVGDVVECGVAGGGSAIAVLRTLSRSDDIRDVYLYDTYTGMPEPDEMDRKTRDATHAKDLYAEKKNWNAYSQGKVTHAITQLCPTYPMDRIRFVQGMVEDTIPETAPDKIALLHLDTDFYASTKHTLTHLYPRLVPGGVLVLDDYGAWKGAQQAVDEYMAENDVKIFLAPTDYTQRIGIKES